MKLLLSPIDLRDFLLSEGWQINPEGIAHRLYVLENPNHPRRQLVFPVDEEAPDFEETVRSILDKLVGITNLSHDTLVERAKTSQDDVLGLRIATPYGQSSLPLNFTTDLIAGAQKALKASACTVLKPRIHHPRLSLTDANLLIEKCAFRQTEEGSFVVRVSCPVLAMDAQGELDFPGFKKRNPFVRRVMLALYQGVQRLISAVEVDALEQLVDEVRKSEQPTISSNLCEAITSFRDDGLDNSVDLSIDWSVVYPMAVPTFMKKLKIKKDYFPRIEEVQRELRQNEDDHEDTFVGTVEGLDGEMTDSGERAGEVLLTLLLADGESVRVKAVLNAQQYRQAITAHLRDDTFVKLNGRLRPGRQPRQLTDLRNFEIIGANDFPIKY